MRTSIEITESGQVNKKKEETKKIRDTTRVSKLFEKEFYRRLEQLLEQDLYISLENFGNVGLVEVTNCPQRASSSITKMLERRNSRIDPNNHLLPSSLLDNLTSLEKERGTLIQELLDKVPQMTQTIVESMLNENKIFRDYAEGFRSRYKHQIEKDISRIEPEKAIGFYQNLNFKVKLPWFNFRCGFTA